MRFIDEVNIRVSAGKGGNGCIGFRREKYIPKGGPDGGDGGRGGSIYLEGSEDVQTLIDFRYQAEYRAHNGQGGMGSQMNGRGAEDIFLKVPLGTLVHSDDGEIDADICSHGQRVLVAKGGKGGLGNVHFKNSVRQTPRIATPGEPGEERTLFLELKLLSHVGLVGFPNAGKSTLLSVLTSATPKIGDYPFTTLAPQLGVLHRNPNITLADIPGLLEGAHEGVGLGTQFLRHISRSAQLLFVLTFDREMHLERMYGTLLEELRRYDATLLKRPRLVCVNKADLLESASETEDQREIWRADWKAFKKSHPEVVLVSAKQRTGISELEQEIIEHLLLPQAAVLS